MREGDIIADRYRLVRVIGAGGMGEVWLAEHTSLKTPIAIKLVHANLSDHPEVRSRFMREAQIAARLKSAHVVLVFDHGITEEGQPFIAMEWLEGESVRDRLDARRRMTVDETARLVKHVCRALTRAHEAGLVHRDLKPENLFIVKEADEEFVKVLDFGVAKATDALAYDGVDPTRTGALMGTPFYMSPEQAMGLKSIDGTTDLWALGAVVLECLTGVRAFTAPALGPLVVKIVNGPTPVPSQIAPDAGLTADIDAWMARALARDRANRFATAAELCEAFMVASGSIDSLMRSGGHPVMSPAHVQEAATTTLADDPGLADTVATSALPSPRPAALVTAPQELPAASAAPPPAPVVAIGASSRPPLLAVIAMLILVVLALVAMLVTRR